MRIPVIKVKDGNYEHIVGSNSHDVLYVDGEGGGIHYLDVQCQEGTRKYDGEQTMQFVGVPGYFEDVQIQFMTVEELVGMAIKNMVDGTDAKLKLHQMLGEYLKAKEECQERLEDNEVTDTSGALLF